MTTVTDRSAATASAALMVSTIMASTTASLVAAENTGASRVLAAASRLTAITSPMSAGAPVCVPLMIFHPASPGRSVVAPLG